MENLNQHAGLMRVSALITAPIESALLILAEPGLGKSHLLTQAASAASSSVLTARVHGRPAEAGFELSGFSAFFDALRGNHHAAFGHHLVLRSERPDRLFTAAQDLAELIQGMHLRPTAVFIDDIDVMDPLSQSLISILSGHLVGTNVRIVATAVEAPPHSPLDSMPTITLKPLTQQATTELAEQLAPQARMSTLQILTQYVHGNPLVLAELLTQIEPYQLAGVDWLTLPPRSTPTIEAIARAQVKQLDQGQRTLLETIALSPATHVAALRQVSPDAADLLDDLADLALVRVHGAYVSVTDPRVRMHLHWSLTSRTRRERLAALANLTEQFDPHLAVWCRSSGVSAPAKTDEMLDSAAHLVSQGRIEEGIELAEKSLGRAHDISRHSERIGDLSSRLLRAGELDLSERYSGRALPYASTPHEHLRLATLRASARLLSSRRLPDDEAHTLVSIHAATNYDAAGNLLTLAAMHRAERWEVDQARALLEPTGELDGQLTEMTRRKLTLLQSALDALDGIPVGPNDPLDDTANETNLPPDLLLMRGRALTWRERYAEARRTFTIVLTHPNASAPLWRNLATFGAIGNEIGAGEFHLARESIRTWMMVAPPAMLASSENLLLTAWLTYCAGDFDTALENIEASLFQASREVSQSTRARALALRGTIGLLRDDPEGVVTDLRQVTSMSVLFRNPGLLRHWPDYVEACLLTGRLQEAGAARRALERRLTTHHTRWGSLAQLRINALLAEDEAPELFATAVKHFGADDSPYELGRTLLAYANRLTNLGRAPEARRALTSALTAFERAGADAWARHLPVNRGSSGPNEQFNQLTMEERYISRRVFEGERNQDIAASLHLSVRTVELRLTHIYRTLGVRSRTELVAYMNGHGLGGIN